MKMLELEVMNSYQTIDRFHY